MILIRYVSSIFKYLIEQMYYIQQILKRKIINDLKMDIYNLKIKNYYCLMNKI